MATVINREECTTYGVVRRDEKGRLWIGRHDILCDGFWEGSKVAVDRRYHDRVNEGELWKFKIIGHKTYYRKLDKWRIFFAKPVELISRDGRPRVKAKIKFRNQPPEFDLNFDPVNLPEYKHTNYDETEVELTITIADETHTVVVPKAIDRYVHMKWSKEFGDGDEIIWKPTLIEDGFSDSDLKSLVAGRIVTHFPCSPDAPQYHDHVEKLMQEASDRFLIVLESSVSQIVLEELHDEVTEYMINEINSVTPVIEHVEFDSEREGDLEKLIEANKERLIAPVKKSLRELREKVGERYPFVMNDGLWVGETEDGTKIEVDISEYGIFVGFENVGGNPDVNDEFAVAWHLIELTDNDRYLFLKKSDSPWDDYGYKLTFDLREDDGLLFLLVTAEEFNYRYNDDDDDDDDDNGPSDFELYFGKRGEIEIPLKRKSDSEIRAVYRVRKSYTEGRGVDNVLERAKRGEVIITYLGVRSGKYMRDIVDELKTTRFHVLAAKLVILNPDPGDVGVGYLEGDFDYEYIGPDKE